MAKLISFILLVEGIRAATFSDINLATTPLGTRGFKFVGSAGNKFGDRATGAGDFNGDGLSDIIFASLNTARVRIVYGRSGSTSFDTITASNFTASDTSGFTVSSLDRNGAGWFGASGVGDINKDGIDDVAIGVPAGDYSGRTDAGYVYVIYGRRTGIADIDVTSWASSTTNGFRYYGEKLGDNFGFQVFNIGDHNGDGNNDFGVFALNGDLPNSGSNNYGVTYVIFGKGAAHGTDVDMLSGFAYGTQGFRVYPHAAMTISPAACGDVNNDGYADVAITAGTGTFYGRAGNGAVYIIFGHSTATSFADVYLSAFTSGTAGFLIVGAVTGDGIGLPNFAEMISPGAVGRGGDFNGDGLNDLAIGAKGLAYILFGRSGVTSYSDIDLLSWPDPTNKGQKFRAQTVSTFGSIAQIGALGDFNGDGVGDVFMFNPGHNNYAGWGAVFFGHRNTTAYTDIVFETFTTGATGFRMYTAVSTTFFGVSAGNAGDMNGDGAPDLVVASSTLPVNGVANCGAVFVLYGEGPPTSAPSSQPTRQPSSQPSSQPSRTPSARPSIQPTTSPSAQPSAQPSSQPSMQPSVTALQSILASPTYKVRNGFAFAALGPNGKAEAWGEAPYGGDATAVLSRLQSDVTAVVHARFAFAAIKADGSMELWGVNATIFGLTRYGGTAYTLSNLVANEAAFAGVDIATGRVIAVGSKHHGGNVRDDTYCNGYSQELSVGVRSITASHGAFAAIKSDSTLLCWGSRHSGADVSSAALSALVGAKLVVAAMSAFAVLLSDNTVASWGDLWTGGDSSTVADQLTEVHHLTASRTCFVAFKKNSGVVVWGYGKYGGDISTVAAALSTQVVQVSQTFKAMAALKADGTVVAWGEQGSGGDTTVVHASLHNVASLVGNGKAFAALTSTGGVVAWGHEGHGGSVPSDKVAALSSGVVSIAHTDRAFAALKSDGSVVAWGQAGLGGSPGAAVEAMLTSGVHTICANDVAFSAIKTDGSVVAWGHSVSVPTAGVQFTSSSLAAGAQCA